MEISTHAPLARCDEVRYFHRLIHRISTHAPLARCDFSNPFSAPSSLFQLTHLLRGATNLSRMNPTVTSFQLTHLLRGATRTVKLLTAYNDFNSRTSCEVRLMTILRLSPTKPFQLTHLLRGATRMGGIYYRLGPSISTHAPLARCDIAKGITILRFPFQLTHLLRGATDSRAMKS